jgi:hypothetical protein
MLASGSCAELWQPAKVAETATAIAWANRVNASQFMVLFIDDDIGWR